ncbi:MAG TPA: MerR family DNA-binding transcriptional regulator [Propionibacteriaceae bacterium]|nr:MerR family DNA-binding transcriptional regulator [Propionibacteriaceae bacterium]
MTEAAQGDYLTLEQAADLLHIHQRTLLRYEDRGLIRSGRLPGGGRRYVTAEVRALITLPPAEDSTTADAEPQAS